MPLRSLAKEAALRRRALHRRLLRAVASPVRRSDGGKVCGVKPGPARSRFWAQATYLQGLIQVEKGKLKEGEDLFCKVADPKRSVAKTYELKGLPTTFLIDRAGNVISTHLGFQKDRAGELEAHIEKALASTAN